MKACAIIPSYNHYRTIDAIVDRLRAVALEVIIIDDGSEEPARSILSALNDEAKSVFVIRSKSNHGKGAAVIKGLQIAIARGYTHAIQIDADGQHDLDALPSLLELMRTHPEAVITGKPIYDRSVPRARLIGRYVTHLWVWIETLSLRITDSMCGFRAYPLAAVKKLLTSEPIGTGMEFDTEILVRLFWQGTPPIMLPVKVCYPVGNSSNFNLWRDNYRISVMHARLFLTMLTRLPKILRHRPLHLEQPHHWAHVRERGVLTGLRFCALAYRLFGRKGMAIIMAPIVYYFYLTGTIQRAASRDFLSRALKRPPSFRDMFRHHMNFALQAVDLLGAWTGQLHADEVVTTDAAALAVLSADPKGAVFIVSHLGNAQISRAMLDPSMQKRLTVLVHSRNAENFDRLLRRFAPDAVANMVQVTEMGPETIIDLKQRIENGQWIVIAGDRISVQSHERSVRVPFWGQDAAFPQGPWVLAALMECPVYLLSCVRDKGVYRLTIEHFANNVILPRDARDLAIYGYAARYAERLEYHSAQTPFQWYNFYDFWAH